MLTLRHGHAAREFVVAGLVGTLVVAALVFVFWIAPTEQTMGSLQRIMYVHVSVAWLGLSGLVIAAATGGTYLLRRNIAWDQSSQAALELGWLCTTLTLLTGSLWAHEAWNTWWTWDPRLTSAFVLWLIYSGVLMVRVEVSDRQRRARVSAVLAIVGVLDVPLVILATRWMRGIHPVAPQMPGLMRATLLFSAAGFAALFAQLFVRRRQLIRSEYAVAAAERRLAAS